MNVACFCGHRFTAHGTVGVCPACNEPTELRTAQSTVREEMERELAALLAEHPEVS